MELASDSNLHSFANFAYERNVEWFGKPVDPWIPYTLVAGRFDACFRQRLMPEYTILFRSDYTCREQRYAAIAHEMYHRVTAKRHSLIRFQWVDEILAYLASQRILEDVGMSYYAAQRSAAFRGTSAPLAFDNLKRARSRRVLLGFGGFRYPTGFVSGVVTIATELESTLPWHAICDLANQSCWLSWLDGLSPELRDEARQLLQLSP